MPIQLYVDLLFLQEKLNKTKWSKSIEYVKLYHQHLLAFTNC